MRSTVTAELREEALLYRLRFTCEDCAYDDADAHCCSHGYPDHEHRGTNLDQVTEVCFCKEFELR